MSALLEVRGLTTHFKTRDGVVRAVDGVSFAVETGKTLAIVGESGSGKSVTALSLMRLIPQPPGEIVSGTVMLRGEDVLKMDDAAVREMRGDRIAMIFQDPMTSLKFAGTVITALRTSVPKRSSASARRSGRRCVSTRGCRRRRPSSGRSTCSSLSVSRTRRTGPVTTPISSRAACGNAG